MSRQNIKNGSTTVSSPAPAALGKSARLANDLAANSSSTSDLLVDALLVSAGANQKKREKIIQDLIFKALAYGKLPSEGFVRIEKVLEVIPVGEATWWAGVASGIYPQSKSPSPGVTAWAVQDIRALINRVRDEEG